MGRRHRGSNTRMSRAAIYARVSTSDQDPNLQLGELREYAHRRGFPIHQEYVDYVTGDVNKRRNAVQFDRLMKDARRRQFDIVLVWKFDRFARSLQALLDGLQTFGNLGIDFVSATQDIDTTTPMGRLFFQMVGAFSEFERSLIVDRVRAGLESAKRRGVKLGRPAISAPLDEIHQMRSEGMSLRGIAKATGISVGMIHMLCKGVGRVI
jgi:DNA invertase Pin-like site-specific DNA recombinase